MFRLAVVIGAVLFGGACWGSDCVQYKKTPAVFINSPDWVKTVIQPNDFMNLWHGNVVATFVDRYDVVADVVPVDDGFCVGVKHVNADVGYSNFTVQIDIRYSPMSCEYNAILEHENKHIKTYLDVMNDARGDFQRALYVAADSVMPIWVPNENYVSGAIDTINNAVQNHPELMVVKQKIRANEEIKNKKVDDDNADQYIIKNCD